MGEIDKRAGVLGIGRDIGCKNGYGDEADHEPEPEHRKLVVAELVPGSAGKYGMKDHCTWRPSRMRGSMKATMKSTIRLITIKKKPITMTVPTMAFKSLKRMTRRP